MPGWKSCAAAALLVTVAAVLSGCAQVIEERAAQYRDVSGIKAGTSAPLSDGAAESETRQTLYFLNREGTALVPVTRSVVTTGFENPASAVLDALLRGPKEGEQAYWPLGEGGQASLQVSGRMAVVDLPVRYRTLEPQMLFAVRQAVAETLCAVGMDCVNVLTGGREEGADLAGTMPAGAFMRMSDMDVEARYSLMEDERQAREGFTRMALLFMPSADGKLLLPEMRSLNCASATSVECLYAVLEEIGRGGAGDDTAARIPRAMDYMEEMPEVVRTEDGGYLVIRLKMKTALREKLNEAGIRLQLYLAMLTENLMGFVPGVDGVQVFLGERQVRSLAPRDTLTGKMTVFRDGLLTRSSFPDLLGVRKTVYGKGSETGRLKKRSVLLPAAQAGNPRTLLEGLMSLEEEERPFPPGISLDDVLAIRMEKENVVLNLSERFYEALAALPDAQARQAVYALVNTLTEGNRQQGAVFFFAGRQQDSLGDGLVMRGRLLRNPGMVEE